MFLGLKPEQWLAFTVLGALVTTAGSLLGTILKEYFFSRSLENWKQKKALEYLYQKYSNPLFVSAKDLVNRLIEILDDYPPNYLNKEILDLRPVQLNPDQLIGKGTDDPYFKRYKLLSTAYRLSSFIAWLELYRQEMVFLDSGKYEQSKKLEKILHGIRSDLADGQLNASENWLDWKEYLIFREEIRAIGEFMLAGNDNSKTVMGYKKYVEILEPQDSIKKHQWLSIIFNFILDLEGKLDFRKCRLTLLLIHLINLIEFLCDSNLEERYIDARTKYIGTLSEYPLAK
jgi:hypothetical protein